MPVTIDAVRGVLDDDTKSQILAFWQRSGAAAEPDAESRLQEVVCVLQEDGAIAGVSSVRPVNVELIGNRPFWLYNDLLPGTAAAHAHDMIRCTFQALDGRRSQELREPMGLCVLLSEPARRTRPSDAQWREPRLVYAGYLSDGTQVRVAYFSDEVYVLEPGPEGWVAPPGFGVSLFADQDDVSEQDVIDLWVGDGALTPERAQERVKQVVAIATDPQHRPIAVVTSYLRRNAQLLADFWYFRAYVARAHRTSHVATLTALAASEHLEARFVSGEDLRAIGITYEIQYEPWKVLGGKGLWLPSDFLLIGENDRGDHVRVHYFAGAQAPEPPAPTISAGY